MQLRGTRKNVFVLGAALVTLFCAVYTVTAFVADRYAVYAERLLDDPATEGLDIVDLSEDTMPAYRAAIDAYESAARFAPLHAGYRGALADLYSRIDVWSETMRLVGTVPAEIADRGGTARQAARRAMREALVRDPVNVDLYIASGHHMMARGEKAEARQHLLKAAEYYPVNSPTRLAVAMGLLTMGYRDDALEQTSLLARNDDSYIMLDSAHREIMAERRTADYLELLRQSYLLKALELAVRITGRDSGYVKSIVPDNSDAREVYRLFLEGRGFNE